MKYFSKMNCLLSAWDSQLKSFNLLLGVIPCCLPCSPGEDKPAKWDSGPGKHQSRSQPGRLHSPLCHLRCTAWYQVYRTCTHTRGCCGKRWCIQSNYTQHRHGHFIFLCRMLCGLVWLQVSAMKCGLLPISPEALSLGEVAYHDYHGILVDEEESTLIQRNLGPNSKVTAESVDVNMKTREILIRQQ